MINDLILKMELTDKNDIYRLMTMMNSSHFITSYQKEWTRVIEYLKMPQNKINYKAEKEFFSSDSLCINQLDLWNDSISYIS